MDDATKNKATIKGTIAKGGGTNHAAWVEEVSAQYLTPDQHGKVRQVHFEYADDYTDFWVV